MGTVRAMNRCEKCGFMIEEVEVDDDLAWDKTAQAAQDGSTNQVWTAAFTMYCPNCANPIPVRAQRVYAADGRLLSEDVEFPDE